MSGNGDFFTSILRRNIHKTGGMGRVPKSSMSVRMCARFKYHLGSFLLMWMRKC